MRTHDKISTGMFRIDLDRFFAEQVRNVVSGLGDGHDGRQPEAEQREVTITRNPDKSEVFDRWIRQSLKDPLGSRTNITITELDNHGKPVRAMILIDAWTRSWNVPSLSSGSAGSASETVTLSCEMLKIEQL
ncbi:phage tail protein [Nocardia sp. NPDC046763]|uniref:phage tail protein n=1 Tax=Nocardia sp. NPDC046763 TaxID=3155256 RepID=UPI0033E01076